MALPTALRITTSKRLPATPTGMPLKGEPPPETPPWLLFGKASPASLPPHYFAALLGRTLSRLPQLRRMGHVLANAEILPY